MTNLQPWIDGDIKGQEEEGYKEGFLHCTQGWCTDGAADKIHITPFSIGYDRGWDEAKTKGLHGTQKIQRDRSLYLSKEAWEQFQSIANSISEEDRKEILKELE